MRKLLLVAGMLILCLVAGLYLVKMVGTRAEEAKQAEAEAEAQAEAEAAAETEAAEKAASEKSEYIYAYRASSDDQLYTPAAYDSAIEAGAGIIVLPFVVSQDGTLYVADDDDASSLTGTSGAFSGMVDSQIDALETKAGTKVMKVSDALEKHGNDIKYVIEAKYTSERNQQALADLINKYGCADNVIIASRYFGGLSSLEAALPDIPKLFICEEEATFNEALGRSDVDIIAVSKDMMSEEKLKTAHDNDKKFGAWVLDSEEDIKSAISMGADSYFTDEAALAVGLEKDRQN